jgi:uncharacterized membrane protein YvbJ
MEMGKTQKIKEERRIERRIEQLQKKEKWKGYLKTAVFIVLLVLIFIAGYYGGKYFSERNQINETEQE